MRFDEEFVLDSMVTHVGGSYRDGEDPPDAYIDMVDRVIAVEVTRLIEPMLKVSSVTGQSRLAGDSHSEKMASDLKTLVKMRIPAGQSLMLMVSAPLNNVQGMNSEIKLHIEEVVELGYADRLININGDAASITINKTDCKISGLFDFAIFNDDVSADIGENVMHAMRERMTAKAGLPDRPHSGDEYWLCMLNEIWLANTHSSQLAFSELGINHSYDRVYIVHSNGEVHRLIDSTDCDPSS